ncbi:ETC complex I subunit [Parvularcula sp. LCG005]|uniref:ETC complex I subunit n=1 Tax=Parvularcula sp. LCG005 TaxID=3078805 RepID=UPI002941EDDE|nr:ETC complex I subunit [Parvularcula sp. LCG005]WOI54065.1 ETC complex I subunit [Parvularcula sp. LCG005]
MLARIYQPAKTAMQSGKTKAQNWVLEFEQQSPRTTDPLMGWTSGSDMLASEVRLKFDTKEAAIAYAKEHKIAHEVIDRNVAKPVIKAYSDNFSYRRRMPWTH